MANRKYDLNQAIDVDEYEFVGNQKHFPEAQHAKKILVTADIRGKLPKYLKQQIAAAGFKVKKIGYTTYVKNVFALY